MILNDKQLSTKQQMIDKIYECIADKTLSLGCFYFSEITRKKETYDGSVGTNYIRKVIGHPVMIGDVLDWLGQNGYFYFCHHKKHVQFKGFKPIFSCEGIRSEDQKKSGWHGTNIYCKCNDYKVTLGDMREEKRKPIEDQSDECIRYIYSLLPPEVRK